MSQRADRSKVDLSVVVVVHNMAREAPRTLFSLSATYQRNIGPEEYEVIVIDNGSTPPLDRVAIDFLRGNFRLIRRIIEKRSVILESDATSRSQSSRNRAAPSKTGTITAISSGWRRSSIRAAAMSREVNTGLSSIVRC
jgi:hypothetical protein